MEVRTLLYTSYRLLDGEGLGEGAHGTEFLVHPCHPQCIGQPRHFRPPAAYHLPDPSQQASAQVLARSLSRVNDGTRIRCCSARCRNFIMSETSLRVILEALCHIARACAYV
jgi:hypothetical protein